MGRISQEQYDWNPCELLANSFLQICLIRVNLWLNS